MKTNELRNLTAQELTARLVTLEEEYFTKTESVRVGKEKNHGQLMHLRRDIARLKTLLRAQETNG